MPSQEYQDRLAEVIARKFKEQGVDPSDGMTEEEISKAEDITREAEDEVRAELREV
jgi:hypothetical protein